MTLNGVQPSAIRYPGAKDTPHFALKVVHSCLAGNRGVAEIGSGCSGAEGTNRGHHAAVKLKIVVAVEDVVFPVVQVLDSNVRGRQQGTELRRGRGSIVGARVGIASPVQIDLGKVVRRGP